MRLAIISAVLQGAFVAAGTLEQRDCNRDNCLRAVVASAFPTRSGIADCQSFMLATVTPPTQTVLVTETATVTISSVSGVITPPHRRDLEERQVTVVPSSIPAYASPCSGAVRYSSACSCVGVNASTTTVAAPTKIITVTATATAPSVPGSNYLSGDCTTNFQSSYTIENGECVALPNTGGVKIGQFVPTSSCPVSKCQFLLYNGPNFTCAGPASSTTSANPQCINVIIVGAIKLVCDC